MAKAHLTRRALQDIEEIDLYSTEKWGNEVALQSLEDLQEAIVRLETAPGLLTKRPSLSEHLLFYPVRRHFLICESIGDDIDVLAIGPGAMDLPSRVAELEPQLRLECRLLHDRLAAREDSQP